MVLSFFVSLILNWVALPLPGLEVYLQHLFFHLIFLFFSFVTCDCFISFVDQSEVFMLQPFTSKDFAIRTLADRVSDLKHLMYLYPDIPKDQAFGKYYTPFSETQAPTNGYVKPLLVTHVPG